MQESRANAPRSPRLPASALNPDFEYALPRHLALLNSTGFTSADSAGRVDRRGSSAGRLGPSKAGGYARAHTPSLDVLQDHTGGSHPSSSVIDVVQSLRATDTPHLGPVTHALSMRSSRSAPIGGAAAVPAAEVADAGADCPGGTIVASPFTRTGYGTHSGGSGIGSVNRHSVRLHEATAGAGVDGDAVKGREYSAAGGAGRPATAAALSASTCTASSHVAGRGGSTGGGVVELQDAGGARPGRDGGRHTRRREGNARSAGGGGWTVKRLERQLDKFGEDDLFLGRFELLGRKHRRRGGVL